MRVPGCIQRGRWSGRKAFQGEGTACGKAWGPSTVKCSRNCLWLRLERGLGGVDCAGGRLLCLSSLPFLLGDIFVLFPLLPTKWNRKVSSSPGGVMGGLRSWWGLSEPVRSQKAPGQAIQGPGGRPRESLGCD